MHTLKFVSRHTPAHSSRQHLQLGGGAGALQAQRLGSSARPLGLTADAGVILSLDQWTIFGDTGLGAGEQRRQGASTLVLGTETSGLGGQPGQIEYISTAT